MSFLPLIIIAGCLLTAYGALIVYYRRAWLAIPEFDAGGKTAQTRISVLIAVRNEAANIAACLDSLQRQSYPKSLYQVIVIDDHSTDTTKDIVDGLPPRGMDLVRLSLASEGEGQRAYKKMAIELGVARASGDLIVTTDADCRFHPDWLHTLAVFYEEKHAKFIAAPVRMIQPDGAARDDAADVPQTALGLFQILDFITLQGITGAAVARQFHSMCNGANLAYEKAAFGHVGGFRDIDDIPSGDDMLLMHKFNGRFPGSVAFLKSRSAIVSTKTESSWRDFVHQRTRWASKADRYDDRRIFRVLLLVYILNAALLLMPVAAIFDRRFLWLFLVCLLIKTLVEYPFVSSVAEFFQQRRSMKWFAPLQPFHIVYTVVIGWMGKFGSYRWKGRTIQK